MQYDLAWISIEIITAIVCAILVRFMMIPYRLTGEGRYVGLPLGFGILGLSYILTVISFVIPLYAIPLTWLIHLTRTFSFVFLATTYFLSNKPYKKTRLISNLSLSLLIITLITLCLLLFISPQFTLKNYSNTQLYIRIIGIICLAYVSIYTLRTHVKNPELTTIWIPVGFILLAISQAMLLLWYYNLSSVILWIGFGIRLAGLVIFLLVAYHTFYRSKEKGKK